MNKGTVTDVFETLGGVAQSTGQQAVTQVKKMGGDALESLGATATLPAGSTPPASPATPSSEQIQKMDTQAKAKAASRYQQIQAEIKAIQEKRKKEIPKEVSGKPGFDEGKMVKQLETGPSFAKATEGGKDDKNKLPPVNVQREKTKTERMRGVSG